MPRYLTEEPAVIPLDVRGAFVRLGSQTYVHYEQVAGFRTVEVPIWGGPKVEIEIEVEEEFEAVEIVPGPAFEKAETDPEVAKEAEKADAKARVEAAQAVIDQEKKELAEAPRITMTQVYLVNRYGALNVDTPGGEYTSTPLIRHTIEELIEALSTAASNKAVAEAKVMSGLIAGEITRDLPEGNEVNPLDRI